MFARRLSPEGIKPACWVRLYWGSCCCCSSPSCPAPLPSQAALGSCPGGSGLRLPAAVPGRGGTAAGGSRGLRGGFVGLGFVGLCACGAIQAAFCGAPAAPSPAAITRWAAAASRPAPGSPQLPAAAPRRSARPPPPFSPLPAAPGAGVESRGDPGASPQSPPAPLSGCGAGGGKRPSRRGELPRERASGRAKPGGTR